MTLEILHGDCIEVMRGLPDNSVDSIVTDPPYGLGFMGKAWDALPPGLEWAEECLRVLKPGGHLLAFGGTRTWHRLAVAVEDAGFEIRDSLAWMYGSGFPKSMDVSKAIDKAAGATREVVGSKLGLPGYSLAPSTGGNLYEGSFGGTGDPVKEAQITAPATPAAQQWQGWGTALKPAFEPVVVGRKPLAKGTVAANVLEWGCGALNIDASRIESGADYHELKVTQGGKAGGGFDVGSSDGTRHTTFAPSSGRWPANVILDEHSAALLDGQTADMRAAKPSKSGSSTGEKFSGLYGSGMEGGGKIEGYSDSGGASRFFKVIEGDECHTSHESSSANTVVPTTTPPSPAGGSALGAAATSGHPDMLRPTGLPSTSDTPTKSRQSAPSNTPAMMDTESASLLGLPHVEHTQTPSHVNGAEGQTLTGTTTTTTSLLTSDGSADPATFSTTPRLREPGGTVSETLDNSAPFKYTAKAPKSERPVVDGVAHETVKPLALMRYLVKLVTPTGGTVLEPFAGSGTTVEACLLEGFGVIAIEREAKYLPLIQARVDRVITKELEELI